MNIQLLSEEYHNATQERKKEIEESISKVFNSLPEDEKEAIKNEFSQSWDNKLNEATKGLKDIDLAMEMLEASKYISLSKLAKDYFGKSKEWLYQRIKGYSVNGKPAQFTNEEREKLSFALKDISQKIYETSLKIS